MPHSDVVDLVVINFGIAVSKYVSKTDDISGVRDLLRDLRSGFVKAIHRLSANLQDPLHCGTGLFICKILLEAVASDKRTGRVSVVLDVLDINAGVTLRHRRGTCSARCSTVSDGSGPYGVRSQVYGSPEETLKRFLEIEKARKAAGHRRLEFHEHIDITSLGVKVAAEHRSE